MLFYLEGKSGAEAAVTLGISETALRVRLHRARAALRERLEEKLEGSLANLRPAKTLVSAVMAGISLHHESGNRRVVWPRWRNTRKILAIQRRLPFCAAGIGVLPSHGNGRTGGARPSSAIFVIPKASALK